MTFRKHTTVVEVLDMLHRHELADVTERVAMCRCGRWFSAPEKFNAHLREEASLGLTAVAPRAPRITDEILAEVAEVYRNAPEGEKTRRVAAFLGVSARSSGTYVSRARKAGFLEFPGRAA